MITRKDLKQFGKIEFLMVSVSYFEVKISQFSNTTNNISCFLNKMKEHLGEYRLMRETRIENGFLHIKAKL